MNNQAIKQTFRVIKTKTRLYQEPEDASSNLYKNHGSELLFNELFEGSLLGNGWVEGKAIKDGYTGVVNLSALRELSKDVLPQEGDHAVCILFAPVYKEPHLKSHILYHIPYAARVNVQDQGQGNFLYCEEAKGWLHKDHIAAHPLTSDHGNLVAKLVAEAQLFLGCPYIFGGKTAFGVDCSALIQLIFMQFGHILPRDTGPQIEFFNAGTDSFNMKAIKIDQKPQKGDIVYFPGHVGIMQDQQTLIHASGKAMQVIAQNIAQVSEYYLETQGHGITHIFRL